MASISDFGSGDTSSNLVGSTKLKSKKKTMAKKLTLFGKLTLGVFPLFCGSIQLSPGFGIWYYFVRAILISPGKKNYSEEWDF